MRDTAVFYASWFDAARQLPSDEFKKLFLAIADYAFEDKEEASLPPVSQAIFSMAKPIVKKNIEKWNARKESGRPAIPVSKGQVEIEQERKGTVRAAAHSLGMSESTAYRRKRLAKADQVTATKALSNLSGKKVLTAGEALSELSGSGVLTVENPLSNMPKTGVSTVSRDCQNCQRVNVNANVNVNVNKQIDRSSNPPKPFKEALSDSTSLSETGNEPCTEEEARQAEAIFDRLPFRRPFAQDHENGPQCEGKQAIAIGNLPAFFQQLSENAEAESREALSASAQAVYEGEASAYSDAAQMLALGFVESAKKQLEWRKNRANIERGRDSEGLGYACHFEGQYRAFTEVLRIAGRFAIEGKGEATAHNGRSAPKNAEAL